MSPVFLSPVSLVTWRRSDHLLGKKIIFVTNNAAKSRPMYVKTFEKMGLEAKAVGPLQLRPYVLSDGGSL